MPCVFIGSSRRCTMECRLASMTFRLAHRLHYLAVEKAKQAFCFNERIFFSRRIRKGKGQCDPVKSIEPQTSMKIITQLTRHHQTVWTFSVSLAKGKV